MCLKVIYEWSHRMISKTEFYLIRVCFVLWSQNFKNEASGLSFPDYLVLPLKDHWNRGGRGGVMASPPDLGRSVKPISIRGPDCAPLGFSKVPTALMYLGTLSYNAILTL